MVYKHLSNTNIVDPEDFYTRGNICNEGGINSIRLAAVVR